MTVNGIGIVLTVIGDMKHPNRQHGITDFAVRKAYLGAFRSNTGKTVDRSGKGAFGGRFDTGVGT